MQKSGSMADAPKIIVFGSLNGQIETAFKKLSALQAKNNFAIALLVGDVFTPSTDDSVIDGLLNGTIEPPTLPTYFTIGTHPLPPKIAEKIEKDEEICPNLHFLGKRSITKLSEGLRIVTLGGQLDSNLIAGQSKEQHLPFHTADDAKALKGANTTDILLTSAWPAGVWNGSRTVLDAAHQAALKTTQEIAELAAKLKPRYHFSASPETFYYEREPYMTPAEDDSNAAVVTRFISMAPFGNEAKQKSMYAFTLNKADTSIPSGATITPFAKKEKSEGKRSHDHYDGQANGRDRRYNERRNKRRGEQKARADACFFCLSNPDAGTHMVCAIGDDAYITTAKGPLTKPTTFSEQGLKFPGQFIIIPLPHAPTMPDIKYTTGEDGTNDPVKAYNDMTRFREAIQAMVAAKSSHKLGVITYEISRERNVHIIWQTIAFPADQIKNGIAETAFKVEAENNEYPKFETRELTIEDQMASGGDFFRVWLWADDGEDKIKGKSLVMPLPSDLRFDLQFGRRVVAKLLNLEDRMVWRDCAQSIEEETKDAEAFQEAFKPWNWTLDD